MNIPPPPMNALAAAQITAAHSHLLKIILKALYVRFKCDVEIDLDFYVRARACNWKNAQQSFYTSAVKYTLYVTSPRPKVYSYASSSELLN